MSMEYFPGASPPGNTDCTCKYVLSSRHESQNSLSNPRNSVFAYFQCWFLIQHCQKLWKSLCAMEHWLYPDVYICPFLKASMLWFLFQTQKLDIFYCSYWFLIQHSQNPSEAWEFPLYQGILAVFKGIYFFFPLNMNPKIPFPNPEITYSFIVHADF